ncbi:unnamed protein product [Closterium sp. NIES-54]
MALRPSSLPQCVPLSSPLASSLHDVPDPESDLARAASPTVMRVLATLVTEPSFESTAASVLVTKLVDFVAIHRLDYCASLVTEYKSQCLLSVGGELALGSDVLEDRQFELKCLVFIVPHLASMQLCPEGDPDAAPRKYHDTLRTTLAAFGFAPSTADPSPFLRTQPYILVYVNEFVLATTDTEALALVKVEMQKRHTCTNLGELRSYLGLQITWDRARHTITLTQSHMVHQAPREWHDMLRTTLAALGFRPSSANLSLFVRSGPTPFCVLVYVNDLVFAKADKAALAEVKFELQKSHMCTDLGELRRYLGLQITRDRAARTITISQHTPLVVDHRLTGPFPDKPFEPSGPYAELVGCLILGAGAVSSSVDSSIAEAEIYAGAMAAHELRWLTFLLTDLGLANGGGFLGGGVANSYSEPKDAETSFVGLFVVKAVVVVEAGYFDDVVVIVVAEAEGDLRGVRWWKLGIRRLARFILWLTRDAAAHVAVRNYLPLAECAHFGQHRTAQALSRVAIFDLDNDAILAAIYALFVSAKDDCYLSVPPDPGMEAVALGAGEAVALGAGEAALPGTVPAEALHTFAPNSGASGCFFCNSTTLTPLSAPVPIRLADPSGGPIVARSSTILLCPAVPSGSLSGLHLPSFSTNLVSTTALQDAMVTTTTPGGQRVSICTNTRTGRHLATFTRQPGWSPYTLATERPQVAASAQVSASGPVAPPCSCRFLSHQSLLWHHRLGHPSLPCLRCMHSRLLVSGLPRSLPPLPPSPAPPCLPCFEGQQRATPHSSFPPRTAPLQTLHMDVWGPARVSGQGRERYFMLVVDDYTRYTTIFPLRSKGEVPNVLIPWIHAVRLQLRERFRQDLPIPRLHSDKGGEFSSNLLRDFYREEGILPSFTLSDSHQQNGIAERRIGLVMEVARTSMIRAAGPHFLWPFAVRYAAHQLILWPRVTLPETSPTLRWTGKVGDASVFWVLGSRAFVRNSSADKLSASAIPCGPAPSGVSSQVDTLLGTVPVEVAVDSGGDTGAGGAGVTAGAGGTRGAAAAGPGGARTRGIGAAGTGGVGGAGAGDYTKPGAVGAGGTRAGGAGAVGVGARGIGAGGAGAGGAGAVDTVTGGARAEGAVSVCTGAGGTVRPRPFFVPLLCQPASARPSRSPYNEQVGSLTERRVPASRPASPVRTGHRVPRPRPPPIPGTHAMALRPSFVPRPTVSRHLATVVTDRSFESTTASALVAELVDFATAYRLDYATALVAESEFSSPPSFGGECALGTNIFQERLEDFECLAGAIPRFASMLLALEGDQDAPDIPTPRSYVEAITGNYVDAVPLSGANIVDGMWIFRVKRPLGSSPAFKARYVARGFSQRQGVDYFQTFSATPKMTTLLVLLHVAAQCDYELHSMDRAACTRRSGCAAHLASLGNFLQRTTLVALGFTPSTADPSLFLRTDTSPSSFYVLVYIDDLVFASADIEALTLVKSELQKRHTCTDLGELRSLSEYYALACSGVLYSEAGRSRWIDPVGGLTTPLLPLLLPLLPSAPHAPWRAAVFSSAVRPGVCGDFLPAVRPEARGGSLPAVRPEAAQELRWLTYVLTYLGEQPRSPPVLYVDNKAMIALCQEHRLEHRTKHIALRYFLARDLQQRGQLRLAYVATTANTADIFTKALPPSDHQRFSTVLGLVPSLPYLLSA